MISGLALFALVGAILVGSGAVRGQSTPATGDAMTITVIEHADTDTVIDLGAAEDSRGDTLAFGNPVFDEANATEIGSSQGSCVRVEVGVAWECA